jgi:hypothetical protein
MDSVLLWPRVQNFSYLFRLEIRVMKIQTTVFLSQTVIKKAPVAAGWNENSEEGLFLKDSTNVFLECLLDQVKAEHGACKSQHF